MDEKNNLENQNLNNVSMNNPDTNINPYDLSTQSQNVSNPQNNQVENSNNINDTQLNNTNPYDQSIEENPYYNPYFQNSDLNNSPYFDDSNSNMDFNNDIYNQGYMNNAQPDNQPTVSENEPDNTIINQLDNNVDNSNLNDINEENNFEAPSENNVAPVNPILNPNINQSNFQQPQDFNNDQFDAQPQELNNNQFGTQPQEFNNNQFDTQPQEFNNNQFDAQPQEFNNNQFGTQPQEFNNNQFDNETAIPNSGQQNVNSYGSSNDEEFKNTWMGKLYEKANRRKFSIPAFFFGGLYYLYRKIYLFGFIFLLISCIIPIIGMYAISSSLTSIPTNTLSGSTSSFIVPILLTSILPIIINIIYAFAFYPLYKSNVNKKLEKYKNEAQSPAQLLDLARQKGGTSVPLVILGILLSGVISSVALITMISSTLSNLFNDVLGGNPTPQNQLNTNTVYNEDNSTPTYDVYNFYGDYYFEYDSSVWTEDIDGKLVYDNYTLSYIQSIENLTSVGFDINQTQGRSSFFTYLYNLFSSQIDASTTTLELGSSSFVYDNGIYYSYFDLVYTDSIERCYFVLIPEDDIFIEFILSNADTVIPDEIHNEVVSYICSTTAEQNQTSTDIPQTPNANIVNGVDNEVSLPDSEMSNNMDTNNINSQAGDSNVINVGNTTSNVNGGLTTTSPTNTAQ